MTDKFKNVERHKVWRADMLWHDDEEVVKASDYDELLKFCESLEGLLRMHRNTEEMQMMTLRKENDSLRKDLSWMRSGLTAFRNNSSISSQQIEWIDQILDKGKEV